MPGSCRRILTVSLAGCLLAGLAACPREGATLRGEPDDMEAVRKLTLAGEPEKALEYFEEAVEREPDNLDAHRGLVEAAYYAGDLAAIADRYQERVEADSEDGVAHYGLALVAVARGPGHMAAALAHFEQAAAALPRSADVPYRIGLVHLLDGQPARARPALERAVELAPERPGPRIALGRCLAELGRGQPAMEVMRAVVGQELTAREAQKAQAVVALVFDPKRDLPTELATEIHRATDLLERDAVQPALTQIDDLAVRFPEQSFVHTLRGLANSRMGNNGEAVVSFERAIELKPCNPIAMIGLGDVYLRLEKWDRARAQFERALGCNPFDLMAYRRLGDMALELGDVERALRSFEALVLLQPDDPGTLHRYADVLVQADRLEQALGVYQTILEREEDDMAALMRKARVHIALVKRQPASAERHRSQARDLLEQAEDLDPENKAVQQLLASLED